MKYRLVYTQRAIRDIKKLEVGTRERIGKALRVYQKDPLNHAVKLTAHTDFALEITGSSVISKTTTSLSCVWVTEMRSTSAKASRRLHPHSSGLTVFCP